MRELAVFYCPKCGYYAYYQTSRHPQCPRCFYPDEMHMVRMHYREFMDMGCKERDDYLALEILKGNPSYIKRITAPHKRFNSREIIAEMNIEIMRLDTENKILSDTVKWMHDTIWEMIREQKGYTDKNVAEILNSLENDDSLKNPPEETVMHVFIASAGVFVACMFPIHQFLYLFSTSHGLFSIPLRHTRNLSLPKTSSGKCSNRTGCSLPF